MMHVGYEQHRHRRRGDKCTDNRTLLLGNRIGRHSVGHGGGEGNHGSRCLKRTNNDFGNQPNDRTVKNLA